MARKTHLDEADLQTQFDSRMKEKDRYRQKRDNWERDSERKELKKQKKNRPVNRKRLQAYEVDEENYDCGYNDLDR